MTTLGFRPSTPVDHELMPWSVPEKVRESFRALYASIRTAGRPGAVALTSIMPGEGVSWIASKLACAFAEANDPVALIDASAGKGSQAEAFGLSRDPAPDEDAQRWTLNQGVEIAIPATRTPGISEVRGEISQLLRSGRTVLIDCEPMSASPQVLQLAPALSGVLLVVEAERERREALTAAVRKLERAGLPLLGTVLNKRRKYIPGILYRAL